MSEETIKRLKACIDEVWVEYSKLLRENENLKEENKLIREKIFDSYNTAVALDTINNICNDDETL